jgi:cation transport protein ChaC
MVRVRVHFTDTRDTAGPAGQLAVAEGAGCDPGAVALMYVALADNEEYLGPAPDADIAAQIARSAGPSGKNRWAATDPGRAGPGSVRMSAARSEYLFKLADALRAMGAEDEHVFAIDALVRAQTAAAVAQLQK